MKIALLFFGLCRSTNYTINSLRAHVFDALKSTDIEYDTYVHTYSLHRPYTNTHAKEIAQVLNNDLYELLKPHYVIIEDQDVVDTGLNLPAYRTHGCPWKSSDFQTLNNHVRSLYSMKRVTEMMLTSGVSYDYAVFIRPDVLFKTSLTKNLFALGPRDIIIPDHAKYPINDRFAICTIAVAEIYGLRFDHALDYSKRAKLHSETYLKHTLVKHGLRIIEKKINFYRVRCNGQIAKN